MARLLLQLLLPIVWLLQGGVNAAHGAALWQDAVSERALGGELRTARLPDFGRRVIADELALRDMLATASQTQAVVLPLPMPDGRQRAFRVWLAPVMAPALAARFPSIQSFKARAVDDDSVSARLSLGPGGLRAYISDHGDSVLIDPQRDIADNRYVAYRYSDYASRFAARRGRYSCGLKTGSKPSAALFGQDFNPKASRVAGSLWQARTEGGYRVYRLAVATTYEYTQAVGGTVTAAMDEINTAVTRVNEIYERDLGIQFQLIANNDQLISTSAADGYSNNNPDALLDENQGKLDAVIGISNYDIGHVLNTGGGGLAALGSACQNNVAGGLHKAYGETGSATPVGDAFYIDLLAHELGHQLGARHTFNGTEGNCGFNRNADTAFEPGSGITIMAYSGLCGAENVGTNSIAAFHAGSIEEIVAFSRNGAGNCASPGANAGNTAPLVDAGADYTIPGGTAFELTAASASDAENNSLTYSWEQMDVGSATNANSYGSDIGSNALFRSFVPVADPARSFPQLSTLLGNVTDRAETLPTQSRALNFRLTVRDGFGGVDADDVVISVDGSKGPFRITQPEGVVTLNRNADQAIEWNVGCTDQAPVSCLNVDIGYSLDGGQTFVPLATATPNDGTYVANFAAAGATASDTVRLRIACSDNVFFAVSEADFALADSGEVLSASGSPQTCGTEVDYGSGAGNDIEPNDTPEQAQVVNLPFSIVGAVDDSVDFSDVFSFVSTGGSHIIELSDYGSNDLDLYLVDVDADPQVVAASESAIATTETIRLGLAAGKTYYVVVEGYFTGGVATAYSLSIRKEAEADSGGGGGLVWWLPCLLLAVLIGRGVRLRAGKV